MSCTVEECTNQGRLVRGLCNPHYQRWYKYGDPLGSKPRARTPQQISERFWSRTKKVGGCIEWQGARDGGYGKFGVRAGLTVWAHRFAWEDKRGEIPEGMTVDHLCRNRACVNVEHMEIVTRGENARRAKA